VYTDIQLAGYKKNVLPLVRLFCECCTCR